MPSMKKEKEEPYPNKKCFLRKMVFKTSDRNRLLHTLSSAVIKSANEGSNQCIEDMVFRG